MTILSTDIPPMLSLEALEQWRDQCAVRLALIAREPDPHTVETFEFKDWRVASVRRGELTEQLLTTIDAINARIRELIAPEVSDAA